MLSANLDGLRPRARWVGSCRTVAQILATPVARNAAAHRCVTVKSSPPARSAMTPNLRAPAARRSANRRPGPLRTAVSSPRRSTSTRSTSACFGTLLATRRTGGWRSSRSRRGRQVEAARVRVRQAGEEPRCAPGTGCRVGQTRDPEQRRAGGQLGGREADEVPRRGEAGTRLRAPRPSCGQRRAPARSHRHAAAGQGSAH